VAADPARLRQTLGGRSGGPVNGLLHHHQGHDPDRMRIGFGNAVWSNQHRFLGVKPFYEALSGGSSA